MVMTLPRRPTSPIVQNLLVRYTFNNEILTRTLLSGILLSFLVAYFVLSDSAVESPFAPRSFERTKQQQQARANQPLGASLDFFIGGFAKCGTTSLTTLFDLAEETSVYPKEVCQPFMAKISHQESKQALQDVIGELDQDFQVKRGFKCPGGVRGALAIERMNLFFPNTRWIVGLRHPVKQLESYYNFRISELHLPLRNKQSDDKPLPANIEIPPLQSLTGIKEQWMAVSMDVPRYELFFMQLGKLGETTEELQEYTNHTLKMLKVVPNQFKLFLYEINQLGDESAARAGRFRRELKNYLGLQDPLPDFPHSNVNRLHYPEHINICDSAYDDLRATMMPHARQTAKWLGRFVQSPDVVTANPAHFLELLEEWKRDPCRDQDDGD